MDMGFHCPYFHGSLCYVIAKVPNVEIFASSFPTTLVFSASDLGLLFGHFSCSTQKIFSSSSVMGLLNGESSRAAENIFLNSSSVAALAFALATEMSAAGVLRFSLLPPLRGVCRFSRSWVDMSDRAFVAES
ncbi:hypothetical protein DY000_02053207 [Brassica cretica]|uniref:Uncharacterized protein n=1 Tax=Brassica cretica TaxID=69181 RepID=A0ABQ7A821_BRACR|nr:hypothetical protein DY000_02053207 [Brassica cretica]